MCSFSPKTGKVDDNKNNYACVDHFVCLHYEMEMIVLLEYIDLL